jgi:hypothetical protein
MSDRERDEKRAGELMRAGAALIDEGLASQLRAFFTDGGPAYAPEPMPQWQLPPGWSIPEESSAQLQAREAAMAAVKPAFLRRLVTKSEAAELRSPEPPPTTVDPSVSRFDFDAWGLQFTGEPRELALTQEVHDRLAEVAPQAVLRDLHRPVIEFPLALQPLAVLPEGDDPVVLAQVMAADYRIRMQDLPSSRAVLAEGIAERRRWIRESDWAAARPTEPAPLPSWLPTANDLKWFGR